MSKISKEFVAFLFVVVAGTVMLRMNARTYADLGAVRSLAAATNTPVSNYLPYVVRPAGTPTATVTATATATPTATSTSVPTAGDVRIIFIEYDPVSGTDVDGEYVDIQNMGGTPQDMTGWKLRDASTNSFTFPSFSLGAMNQARIWTKAGANTATDLYMGKGGAVWNNSGDTATLYDGAGQVVDTCTYAGGGHGASCP